QADAAALRVDTLWANVHNHRMAFYVSGDTASPIVILEAGGASARAWQSLAPEIVIEQAAQRDAGSALTDGAPRTTLWGAPTSPRGTSTRPPPHRAASYAAR